MLDFYFMSTHLISMMCTYVVFHFLIENFYPHDSTLVVNSLIAKLIRMWNYSWPSLVVPYSEEPFSRPFLGENWFWLVLQKRMSTENAVGCLFFSHAHFCLQLQQNTMVPIDVDGQICHFCSQGFVPWQILVVFKRRNPIENTTVNTMRTMVFCWSCKQSSGWSYAN